MKRENDVSQGPRESKHNLNAKLVQVNKLERLEQKYWERDLKTIKELIL